MRLLIFILLLFGCHPHSPQRDVRDLSYGSHDRHRMDVFLAEQKNEEYKPLLVLMHAGAWMSGDKALMTTLADTMRSKGFHVVCLNMRYVGGDVALTQQLDDIDTALDFIQKHQAEWKYSDIFIGGSSSGGHLALMYASSTAHEVAGVIGICAPSDFLDTSFQEKAKRYEVWPHVLQLVNIQSEDTGTSLRVASPRYHLDEMPPVFLMHGLLDEVVPAEQSAQLVHAISVHQPSSVYYPIATLGHQIGYDQPDIFIPFCDSLASWIQMHSK